MANSQPSNLFDQAVDIKGGRRMILVEDCVETPGAFVLHHLLKRALPSHSSDIVIFLSFAHPFSHYDRVLRKMGCNLSVQRDNKRLLFFDMLTSERLDRNRGKTSEEILIALFGEVQKAVEVCLSLDVKQHITVIIDDVSLMEVDASGSSNLVLDFLRYCYSLTYQFGCSLITLIHEDVYSTTDRPNLLLHSEYSADVVIKVEPLATGLAKDVHGQVQLLGNITSILCFSGGHGQYDIKHECVILSLLLAVDCFEQRTSRWIWQVEEQDS